MADSGKNAITTHSGTGSQLTFALSWTTSPASSLGLPYLAEADIKVEHPLATFLDLGVQFDISEDGLSVVFRSGYAPASGTDNVRFTRRTPHAALVVTYVDGTPPTAGNLTDSFAQPVYYDEEVEDTI